MMKLPDILIVKDDCSYCERESLTMVISPYGRICKDCMIKTFDENEK
jgi:hypothetical protein